MSYIRGLKQIFQFKLPDRVQWHEGMLLSPHHFQQADHRVHNLLSYQLSQLFPHGYGFSHLEIDTLVLSSGIVRVLHVEAIMPDGLVVEFEAAKNGDLSVDLSELKDYGKEKDITIYLCVPQTPTPLSEVTGEWPRYDSIESHDVLDENTLDNPLYIPRLRPKLTLIAAEHPPARFVSLPFLKVSYTHDGFVEKTYFPPVLNIKDLKQVHERLIALCQNTREKASYLAEQLSGHSGNVLVLEMNHQLQSLLMCLPELELWSQEAFVHPLKLYEILVRAYGYLSRLKPSVSLAPALSYRPFELYECFTWVFDAIENLLKALDQTYTAISFVQRERLFSLQMLDMYLEEDLLLGIRIPANLSESQIRQWIQEAVIACDSHVETVRVQRIAGSEREVLSSHEWQNLMPARDVIFVRIKKDSSFIKPLEHLNIFNPSDTTLNRPLEISLFVKKQTLTEKASS
ncbi:MAG TPA: type VI secretion system baseplate subunit TssK [Alphaproteobacteria bacterium]|nr:type VI secretion system baseplate subunit TssK [Alphaproteobacteria bacterium]